MSKKTKAHLITASRTFIATFVTVSLSTLIPLGVENWTTTALLSVCVAAVNAALKVAWEAYNN